MKLCLWPLLCVAGCASGVVTPYEATMPSKDGSPTQVQPYDAGSPVPTPAAPALPAATSVVAPTPVVDAGESVDAGVPITPPDAGPLQISDAGAATCVIEGQKYACDTNPFRVTSPTTCVFHGQQYPLDAAEQVGEQCSSTDYPCIAMAPGCPQGWVCWVLNNNGSATFGSCQ